MDEQIKKQDVNDEHKDEEKKRERLSTASLAVARRPTDSKKEAEPRTFETKPKLKEAGGPGDRTSSGPDEQEMALLPPEEVKDLRSRWEAIQVSFVDDPRQSVGQADGLVAAVMKRLAEEFAEERAKLESQWNRVGDVSTEDLRLSVRRYRSFFNRLLSI